MRGFLWEHLPERQHSSTVLEVGQGVGVYGDSSVLSQLIWRLGGFPAASAEEPTHSSGGRVCPPQQVSGPTCSARMTPRGLWHLPTKSTRETLEPPSEVLN